MGGEVRRSLRGGLGELLEGEVRNPLRGGWGEGERGGLGDEERRR
jgi:hypothetical protein